VAVEAIEREEWLIVMGMLADIRAELEGVHDILKGENGEEETEADT
jgi:hypothetical protein